MSDEDRKKLPVRILAFLLAVLMVAGMAYYTIYILVSTVSAGDVIDTSSLKYDDEVMVSVGLMFGSNITTGFQISAPNGYTVGIQDRFGDRGFEEIWDIYEEEVTCTADANLEKNDLTYLISDSSWTADVGGYHIQVDCDHLDRDGFEELMDDTENDVERLGLYLIPSYIYTGYAIRIGDFTNWDDAHEYFDEVREIYPDEIVSIVLPEETAVSVIDPYDARILFEFDCGGDHELGLAAKEDENGNTYITTPAGNFYDGVFCFHRYNNEKTDGVALTNILPLEAYVAGVLPHEITNTWPLETLKAFAITVRSFTLTHIGKHNNTYGFDLCNGTDCQVYKGAGKINDNVMEAILDTAGKVLAYEGDIVTAYYSSSTGGVTVSVKDAWGGSADVPYLQAVETPWEDYTNHNNGFWITEISPEALAERLNTAGYVTLKDAIESVEIKELAKGSTYVKLLEVTDIYGNSVQIKNTDKVRMSMTPYIKSANFVVGKGEVEYTITTVEDFTLNPDDENASQTEKKPDPDENQKDLDEDIIDYNDKEAGYLTLDDYYIITSEDLLKNRVDYSVNILTGDDKVEHNKKDAFVITVKNAPAFLGEEYIDYVTEEKEDEEKFNTSVIEDKSNEDVVYKMAYAEDEDNFIFVGKGWGHGVGISQYGSCDLAELGYSAEEILKAYFKGTEIVPYEQTNKWK
ncbi:MAG: SpoIID/LytB domain-containing protein [Ruminococcaceae bacterium]|nr:SpoIID/LytB domain-containing protein [Oscillospiraceae bacterium]